MFLHRLIQQEMFSHVLLCVLAIQLCIFGTVKCLTEHPFSPNELLDLLSDAYKKNVSMYKNMNLPDQL